MAKNIKILVINLTKDIQDLCTENHKNEIGEIRKTVRTNKQKLQDTRKMQKNLLHF